MGHRVRVKNHKITPVTGKERGDLEIKDYVVLQKPQEQDDRLTPARTLILDFTLTHTIRKFTWTYYWSPEKHKVFGWYSWGWWFSKGGDKEKDFTLSSIESSGLTNEIPEESHQFRLLREVCYVNIKGSVGLTLAKVSVMRISIPLDLSTRPFILLPCFIRSRHPLPLLAPSLVFTPRSSS